MDFNRQSYPYKVKKQKKNLSTHISKLLICKRHDSLKDDDICTVQIMLDRRKCTSKHDKTFINQQRESQRQKTHRKTVTEGVELRSFVIGFYSANFNCNTYVVTSSVLQAFLFHTYYLLSMQTVEGITGTQTFNLTRGLTKYSSTKINFIQTLP